MTDYEEISIIVGQVRGLLLRAGGMTKKDIVLFISLNPKYNPIVYHKKDEDTYSVIGVVVCKIKKYRQGDLKG